MEYKKYFTREPLANSTIIN